jgi:hypothetical protein
VEGLAALLLILGLEKALPALEASAQAAYIQTGLEQSVSKYSQELDRKYLTEGSRLVLSNLLIVGKSIAEQRISITIPF